VRLFQAVVSVKDSGQIRRSMARAGGIGNAFGIVG
jgi:hypothetical protein